jgi:uncharacterized protein (DUF488 family)
VKLYTIGHSNHRFDRLVELLDGAGVATVVDVRTSPNSRYNPQFNRGNLEQALPRREILYYWAGQSLGGRPVDPTCYKSRHLPDEGADYLHEVDYPEVMTRLWFLKGIERLLAIADERPTAILCSEENPAECHRHHLIAKHLIAAHPEIDVRHIRGDGSIIGAASVLASVEDPPGEQLSFL